MKEQDKVKSKLATEATPRPALNSSNLGNDEFKSLGQASSELIAKLTNRAKVEAREETQPPSKMTSGGENNVIYLKFTGRQNLCPTRQNDEIKNSNKKDDPNGLLYIFE